MKKYIQSVAGLAFLMTSYCQAKDPRFEFWTGALANLTYLSTSTGVSYSTVGIVSPGVMGVSSTTIGSPTFGYIWQPGLEFVATPAFANVTRKASGTLSESTIAVFHPEIGVNYTFHDPIKKIELYAQFKFGFSVIKGIDGVDGAPDLSFDLQLGKKFPISEIFFYAPYIDAYLSYQTPEKSKALSFVPLQISIQL